MHSQRRRPSIGYCYVNDLLKLPTVRGVELALRRMVERAGLYPEHCSSSAVPRKLGFLGDVFFPEFNVV